MALQLEQRVVDRTEVHIYIFKTLTLALQLEQRGVHRTEGHTHIIYIYIAKPAWPCS